MHTRQSSSPWPGACRGVHNRWVQLSHLDSAMKLLSMGAYHTDDYIIVYHTLGCLHTFAYAYIRGKRRCVQRGKVKTHASTVVHLSTCPTTHPHTPFAHPHLCPHKPTDKPTISPSPTRTHTRTHTHTWWTTPVPLSSDTYLSASTRNASAAANRE
jgi:hypothetical protein